MILNEKLSSHRLILASHSPRRRELLAQCDLPFEVADKYEVDEMYPDDLTNEEIPAYLSQLKSQSYPEPLLKGDILITADTVVICDCDVMGKPHSKADAESMLRRLSGKTHIVVTGVTLRDDRHSDTFFARSEVTFRRLTEEEICYYVEHYSPMDKAGAYGIQEWIGSIGITRIDGSFYNVMGLPTTLLYRHLKEFIR